jgi:hypothetical protein
MKITKLPVHVLQVYTVHIHTYMSCVHVPGVYLLSDCTPVLYLCTTECYYQRYL